MWPLIFDILNLICGVCLILTGVFGGSLCSWFRLLFAISIIWVAITTQICDQYALYWFPLWNQSFGFMGCSYIFLACGGFGWLSHGGGNWYGFCYFFVWAVGVAYCVIHVLGMLNVCSCPMPVPLMGGGGGGGSSDKDQGQTANA
eukprot:134563_1